MCNVRSYIILTILAVLLLVALKDVSLWPKLAAFAILGGAFALGENQGNTHA